MLQETMKTVCDAEAKADDIIKKAKEEADGILESAKKKASEITEQAQTDSKAKLKDTEARQKENEEKQTTKALDRAAAEIASLRETAAKKEAVAMDMIINELIQ